MIQAALRIEEGRMPASTPAKMHELVVDHFNFIWRSLRRLGVPVASVDDAAQHVFMIASRKLETIVPGREKAFLFGIAVRIASDARRAVKREHEHELSNLAEGHLAGERAPLADELLDRKRMRARLDEFLDGLSYEVRTAFVLTEAEGMTAPEIAELLGVPIGTVASRIRLARKQFNAMVERMRSVNARGGAT